MSFLFALKTMIRSPATRGIVTVAEGDPTAAGPKTDFFDDAHTGVIPVEG
jgi:hypothetical protein